MENFGSNSTNTEGAFEVTTQTGTTVEFYAKIGTDTMMKGDCEINVGTRLQCITCMDEYGNKSIEELRNEDYAAIRKGQFAVYGRIRSGRVVVCGITTIKESSQLRRLLDSTADGDTRIKHDGEYDDVDSDECDDEPQDVVTGSDFGDKPPCGFGFSNTVPIKQNSIGLFGNSSSNFGTFCPTFGGNDTTISGTGTGLSGSAALENLSKKLEDMFINELHWDITIKIGKKEFHVHKSILATQSSVFADKIKEDSEENKCIKLDVSDCDPVLFNVFLLYLYTGKIDKYSIEKALSLYVIAHDYDVPYLKKECVYYMMKNLSVDLFCDIIELAAKYKESKLLKASKEYFKNNARKIILSSKWHLIMKERTTIANELILLAIP